MSLSVAARPFDLLSELDKKSKERAGGLPVYEHAGSSWTGVLVTIGADEILLTMRVVREIIIPPDVTRVPGVQVWLKGIANLRGTLFPVVDLEQFLEVAPNNENPQQRRLLVLEHQGFLIGFLVAAVHGMKNFMNTDHVEQRPAINESLVPFVSKSFQNADEHFPVLDVDLIMQNPQFNQVGTRVAV